MDGQVEVVESLEPQWEQFAHYILSFFSRYSDVARFLRALLRLQLVLNAIRAIPVFVLEVYSVMVLILFTMIPIGVGLSGILPMPKLPNIICYVLGICFSSVGEVITLLILAVSNTSNRYGGGTSELNVYISLVAIILMTNLVGVALFVILLRTPKPTARRRRSRIKSREDANFSATVVVKPQPKRRFRTDGFPNDSPQTPPTIFCSNAVYKARYNAVTFLPLFLWSQFSRLANCYTLFIVILSSFSFSPVDPSSSITPLLIVIFSSAVKEIMEDVKRRKSDEHTNKQLTMRLDRSNPSNPTFATVEWQAVQVGDLCLVKKDEPFPCDMILVGSSSDDGVCYVNTMNLDGETNLKIAQTFPGTSGWLKRSTAHQFEGSLEYEAPNMELYTFDGVLMFHGQDKVITTARVNVESILLRGSELKCVDYAIGLVISAGVDTKVEKNCVKTRIKRSTVEITVNSMLLYLLVLQQTICLICSLGYNNWLFEVTYIEVDGVLVLVNATNTEDPWYLAFTSNGTSTAGLSYTYFTYLIAYNTLIPLSMYISMEIVRVVYARQVDADDRMVHTDGVRSFVTNSSVTEELGQVEFVFSDKTGTLTQNEMVSSAIQWRMDGLLDVVDVISVWRGIYEISGWMM
jgi:hypothetical protein